jgi:CheY-like chemotaxis protein
MKKILIVEDDAVVVQIYRKKFLQEGFQVEVAEDGLAAMRQLPAFKPDLVVLDLMMPKFNGADVLKFIRSNQELKTIKVVIFSNAYMTDLAQEAAKAGADKSLLKSNCTPAQLIAVVKSLLGDGGPGTEAVVPLAGPTPAAAEPEISKAREDFLANATTLLAEMRELYEAVVKTGKPQQPQRLTDLYRKVHFLTDLSGVADWPLIAHLSSALEALLFELQETPKNLTPSVWQTIQGALEFLGVLFERARLPSAGGPLAGNQVLVVDDDAICARAVVHALDRARFRPTRAENGPDALKLLQEKHYDLVLMDYLMPGMDGLELYARLRALPGYQKTPVIFVTSKTDFRQLAQNLLSRGDDVITKPVFPIELAVKILTHLLKRQLLGETA